MTDQTDPPDLIAPPDRPTDPAPISEPESNPDHPVDERALADMVAERLGRLEDSDAAISGAIVEMQKTADAIKLETAGLSRALHDIKGHLAVIRANQDHFDNLITIVSDGVTELVTRTARSASQIEKLQHQFSLHIEEHGEADKPPSEH